MPRDLVKYLGVLYLIFSLTLSDFSINNYICGYVGQHKNAIIEKTGVGLGSIRLIHLIKYLLVILQQMEISCHKEI